MAVNPATMKIIAKVAINTITDEEKRTNLIIGIVIIIVLILMIIIIPIYLITSPLEVIKSYFTEDKDGNILDSSYQEIVNMKEEYDIKYSSIGEINYNGGSLPMPVNDAVVTSEFGSRIHPVTGKQSFHTGIDLAGKWHSSIMSVADGKIVFAGVKIGYGNCIEIEHTDDNGNNFYTVYAHLATINVIEGKYVNKGSIIGIQGGDPNKDPNPRI